MLPFFSAIANCLYSIRWIVRLLTFSGLLYILYLLLVANISLQSKWLTPAFLFFMWGLLLNLLIVCFVGEERENQRKGFFARLKSRFMTFVNGVIILAFIVLSLGTIYVTFKIVTI